VKPTQYKIGVKWLNPPSSALNKKDGGIYTWEGTSHHIHLETLLEVNHDMFHVANKATKMTSKKKSKQNADEEEFFCMLNTCQGRCKGIKFGNAGNQIGHSMKSKGRDFDNEDDDDDDDDEKKKKKKAKTQQQEQTKILLNKVKEEEELYRVKEEKKKKMNKNNKNEGTTKMNKTNATTTTEWDYPNVTGAYSCQEAKFEYANHRFMKTKDGKVVEEKREFKVKDLKEKCTCKRLASIFTSNPEDPVLVEEVHEFNRRMCPTQAIDEGKVLFSFHVFDNGNQLGLGIEARENIKRGSFICEYVGEIVSREEAQNREGPYNKNKLYYLHDLSGPSPIDGVKFSIDPTVKGNFGRFFNHSCAPNCTTLELPNNAIRASEKYKMSSSSKDPERYRNSCSQMDEKSLLLERMRTTPRLAFFACKDIKKGEQLTIDYSPGREGEELRMTVKCACKEQSCKGWLF
jgi:hypothetical protein